MVKKGKKFKLKMAVLFLAAYGIVYSAEAAAEDEIDFETLVVAEAETEPEVKSEETREIVVSATRTEMEVKDSPATITVINRKQIEDRKADNVMDVLRDVSGVQFDRSGNLAHGSALRIRGSEGDHVLILIDGKKISTDPSFYNTRELQRIRMDDVERVEVLKGPASVLYGSSAMGGVINIVTRRPDKDSVEVNIDNKVLEGEGSVQTNLGIYAQAKKRGSFSWTLSAARNYTNDLSFEDNKQEYPGGEEIPINFKGIWDINKNNKIQVDFRYLKENLNQEMYYKNPAYKSMETYYKNHIRKLEYGLNYTGKSDKTNWQFRIYNSEWKKDQDSYKIGTRIWKNFNITRSGALTLEGQISHAFTDKHLVTGGFEYSDEWIGSTSLGSGADKSKTYTRNGKTLNYGKKSRELTSFFIQDEWTPGEKWLIIPAVRVEHSSSFGTEVVPKLGATYFLKPDFRLKANVGKGYRIPTLLELYRSNVTRTMIGNPDLDPETSIAYEVGFEKDWSKHNLKVSFYRSDVKDLIQSKTNGRVTTWLNISDSLLQGIEIGTTHRISKEVDLRLGYNYLEAENKETDERLEGRPRHQFTISGSYTPIQSDWKFSVDASLLADYLYTDNFNDQKKVSYLIANVIIDRKFGKEKNGSIYFGIENIFDRKIEDLSYYGRTYVAGARYKF